MLSKIFSVFVVLSIFVACDWLEARSHGHTHVTPTPSPRDHRSPNRWRVKNHSKRYLGYTMGRWEYRTERVRITNGYWRYYYCVEDKTGYWEYVEPKYIVRTYRVWVPLCRY